MAGGIYKVGRGSISYYLEQTADAPLTEVPGVWHGAIARRLGLVGQPVLPETLIAAANGIEPVSGAVLDDRHDRVKNVAYDLVLTTPKSVSVLFALGESRRADAIARAHDRSVGAVVDYLERHVAFVRSSHPAGSAVPADGLLAAAFRHRTSRAPDPHLHTHLVVVSLAQGEEGGWRALDARELFVHIGAAHSLYGAHLRDVLAANGLHFYARRAGVMDLVGAREALIRTFSRRSAEISARVAELGSGRRGSVVISQSTRPAKDQTMSWAELTERWWAMAERSGHARSALDRLGRSWSSDLAPPSVLDAAAVAADLGRPFSRRELAANLADRAVDGAPISAVERAVDDALANGSVRARPPSRNLGQDRAERRFPRSVTEPRWATPAVAEAIDRVQRTIENAPGWLIDHPPSGESVHIRPRVSSLPGEANALSTLRSAATEIAQQAGRVAALAPSPSLAGHFAAVSGITTSHVAPERADRLDLLVVYGARVVDAPTLDGLLEAMNTGRGHVVFVDRITPRAPEVPVPSKGLGVRDDAQAGPTAVFVSSPDTLASVVKGTVDRLRSIGRRPVVVAADGFTGAEEIDAPVLSSRRAGELARADEGVVAVVIGDDRVLGLVARRAFRSRRVHLAVDPIDIRERASFENALVVSGAAWGVGPRIREPAVRFR